MDPIAKEAPVLKMNLSNEDAYGRMSIPGVRSWATPRQIRRTREAEKNLFHRAKNGVYDAVTYYHVLDLLMKVDPGQDFKTADLVKLLTTETPQLTWDATTVGRVLMDLADTLQESTGRYIIGATKRWNGVVYDMPSHPANRVVLQRLHEDLLRLANQTIEDERKRVYPKRLDSPLIQCPSVV
jgi:hypothetical protein